MAGISEAVTNAVVNLLEAQATGVNVRVVAMAVADSKVSTLGVQQIVASNMPVELAEASG